MQESDIRKALHLAVSSSIHRLCYPVQHYDGIGTVDREILVAGLINNKSVMSDEHICDKCSQPMWLTTYGRMIAEEIEIRLREQRTKLGVESELTALGQVSYFRWPSWANSVKAISQGSEPNVTCIERTSRHSHSEKFYPSEVCVYVPVRISDQDVFSNPYKELQSRIDDVVAATVLAEYDFFGHELSPKRGRFVGVRQPLTAAAVDYYASGRPARGWLFRSIQSLVCFEEAP